MDEDGLLLEHLVIETNDADSLDTLLSCALARICEYTSYPIGHAYLVASDQDEIIPTGVWHGSREDQYRAFHECSISLRLGLGEGLPGRALATRKPVQSPDIREEASFVRRHEAIHAGLRSGFAIPLLSGNQAVATLEFYSPRVGSLEDPTLRLTAVAGVLLGRAVERQKAGTEIRKRAAQLDQAEKLAVLGSWEWTIGSDEMTWSEQLYRIYDVPRASFDGTFAGHLQRTAPADRERIQGILEQAIDDRQPFEFRERLPSAGRVLLTRGEVVLDAAGLPIRVIGVCQDITYIEEARRREMELEWEKAARQYAEDKADELQRLTRELERSNQELDQFAYVASHDLKAPLRGIANLSEWLEEDLGDKLNQDNLKHLELLRGRVHRMESLIDGLLAYSRVSRKHIAPERVDVHRLLDEIIDLLVPPEDVVFDIDPHLPSLTTPRIPLHQVFHNLIGNALKHAHADGLRVEIRARDAGLFYDFSIADDGPGIAPEYHQRIWQIFQTLQPRDKVEGAGMGLALVKKIVEHHGGTVGIESQPRAGATFHFRWPKSVG